MVYASAGFSSQWANQNSAAAAVSDCKQTLVAKMVNCLIKGCNANSRAKVKDKQLRFFGVPAVITRECDKTLLYSRARRAIWLERINHSRKLHNLNEMDDADLKPHNKVCSKHFQNGESYSIPL